jgi:hypothetical protein
VTRANEIRQEERKLTQGEMPVYPILHPPRTLKMTTHFSFYPAQPAIVSFVT